MRSFKFFNGFDKTTHLRAVWMPETDGRDYYGIDAEVELTRLMSEEISRGIDEEIINTLTRRINGGNNNNGNYLNHWLRIGENRA